MGQTRYRTGPLHSTGVTLTGAVQQVTVNANTGVKTVISTPKLLATVAVGAGQSGDSIVTWTQPANTLITSINILCTEAVAISSGDVGYEVGTTSSGVELVAAITDQILNGGTAVTLGNVTGPLLLVQTTEQTTTAPISVQYTAAARSVYCNITDTTNASAAGELTFLIEYISFDITAA